jgi:hypothetical protein
MAVSKRADGVPAVSLGPIMTPPNLPTRHTTNRVDRQPRVLERLPLGLAARASADVAALETEGERSDYDLAGVPAVGGDLAAVAHVTSVTPSGGMLER